MNMIIFLHFSLGCTKCFQTALCTAKSTFIIQYKGTSGSLDLQSRIISKTYPYFLLGFSGAAETFAQAVAADSGACYRAPASNAQRDAGCAHNGIVRRYQPNAYEQNTVLLRISENCCNFAG